MDGFGDFQGSSIRKDLGTITQFKQLYVFESYRITISWVLPKHWKTRGNRKGLYRDPFIKMNRFFSHLPSLKLTASLPPGWCSTPNQLLICSSFSRENGYPLLICSSLSTAQLKIDAWKMFLFLLGWPIFSGAN